MGREITITEVRKIQLEIMDEFDLFCRTKNIKYSLAYGTLLGAIRHKGFIPWDDDIDVIMSRENYNRFINEYSKIDNDNMKLSALECDKDYLFFYAKLLDSRTELYERRWPNFKSSVYVDIFPEDYVPDNVLLRKFFMFLVGHLRRFSLLLMMEQTGNSINMHKAINRIGGKIMHLTLSWLDFRVPLRLVSRFMQFWPPSKHMTHMTCGREAVIESSIMEEYCDVAFEGHTYMAVSKYHDLLTQMFGNYNQLPPKSERVPKHGHTVRWK